MVTNLLELKQSSTKKGEASVNFVRVRPDCNFVQESHYILKSEGDCTSRPNYVSVDRKLVNSLSLSPMMCPWLFWLPLEVSIAQLFPQEARTVEVIPKPILYKQSLKVSSLWTRFENRRVQEELEVLSSKLTRLRSHQEGSPPIERLQDDIKHYKAMIKCSVCHDRSKEVSIHLYAPLVSEYVHVCDCSCIQICAILQILLLYSSAFHTAMPLSLECIRDSFEAVNDFCRLSSQNATTCSVALAFKGTWRSGTGNALAVVCHLARVMSGTSTFNREPADLALFLLINHVLLFFVQPGGCNPNATPISEQTVYFETAQKLL